MAHENGGYVPMTASDDLSAAADGDPAEVDREELLARAVVRLADEHDIEVPDAERVADLERRVEELDEAAGSDGVDDLRSDVEALETEIDELRGRLDDDVEDVRERVVEVLKKVQTKASADHSHPSLAGSVDSVREDLREAEERLDRTEERLDERVGDLEETLARHADAVEDVEEKLTRLAGAVVRLQRRVGELETERIRRDAVADLAAVANRHGVTDADCEDCGNVVHVGLLAEPRCPHCGSHFESVDPKSGFFGSSTLTVGQRPALEGESDAPTEADDLFEDEA